MTELTVVHMANQKGLKRSLSVEKVTRTGSVSSLSSAFCLFSVLQQVNFWAAICLSIYPLSLRAWKKPKINRKCNCEETHGFAQIMLSDKIIRFSF